VFQDDFIKSQLQPIVRQSSNVLNTTRINIIVKHIKLRCLYGFDVIILNNTDIKKIILNNILHYYCAIFCGEIRRLDKLYEYVYYNNCVQGIIMH